MLLILYETHGKPTCQACVLLNCDGGMGVLDQAGILKRWSVAMPDLA